jgi:acylphosphatase
MVLLAKIKIFGRVQGVFFRRSAKKKAEEFGIVGFIHNESDDDSVYLEAQGEEENLKKFIEWCRKGPPLAKVQNLEVNYLKEIKPYTQFLIL